MKNVSQALCLGVCGMAFSAQTWAYTQSCQWVARMAGPAYETSHQHVGSFAAPHTMPSELNLTFVERSGGWFIYETAESWFHKENCAPVAKTVKQTPWTFAPVLRNKRQAQYAVVTPSFMIKTHNKADIELMAERYGFRLLTRLPRGSSAIFDVSGVESYDRMLEELDRDKDIDYAAPVLAEKRYRLR